MKKTVLVLAISLFYLGLQAQFVQKGGNIEGVLENDYLGTSVSLNSDGTIMAVGAKQGQGASDGPGYVNVLEYVNDDWSLKGSRITGISTGDMFGSSVSLCSDGLTVAIGCIISDNNGNKGLAQVYTFNGTDWIQKGGNIDGLANYDEFGSSISISADGSIVAIGSRHYQTSGMHNGYVSIYQFTSGSWVLMGETIVGDSDSDYLGTSVSLSNDGLTVAIGATQNEGTAAGNPYKGYVKILHYNGSAWAEIGNVIWGDNNYDMFGSAVSLNSDGTKIAIGASQSTSQEIPGDPGYVKILEFNSTDWIQVGSNINGQADAELFGASLSMNDDANVLVVGAPMNESNGSFAGTTRLYFLSGANWSQADSDFNGAAGDYYGNTVSLSSDGTTFASGGPSNSNVANGSGIAKVFESCNSENAFSVTVCNSYTSPSGNYTWSSNGTYLDTIPNTEGCDSIMTITVSIAQVQTQSICMVSVDTTNNINKNLIVWEKIQTDSIDHYNIYKEITTDNYELQGSVDYNEISEFVDNTSAPSVHADKYKISVVDNCAHESSLSPYHQTMNLSQTAGAQADEVVLIWNKYIDESGDFVPASYKVYRGLDRYNMSVETILSGGLSSYNYNVEDVLDGEYFMVIVDMPECNPSVNHASGGPYYQSSSNLEDEGVINTSAKGINKIDFNIYPNPSKHNVIIKSSQIIHNVKIYSIAGELISEYLNINSSEFILKRNNISAGTYFIKINESNNQKIIFE